MFCVTNDNDTGRARIEAPLLFRSEVLPSHVDYDRLLLQTARDVIAIQMPNIFSETERGIKKD